MTTTVTVAAAAHAMVERRGARPSSLHAALPADGGGWATACGEVMVDGPRGTMHVLPLPEAWALVKSASPRLCRRCTRVGDSVEG